MCSRIFRQKECFSISCKLSTSFDTLFPCCPTCLYSSLTQRSKIKAFPFLSWSAEHAWPITSHTHTFSRQGYSCQLTGLDKQAEEIYIVMQIKKIIEIQRDLIPVSNTKNMKKREITFYLSVTLICCDQLLSPESLSTSCTIIRKISSVRVFTFRTYFLRYLEYEASG